MPLLLYSQVALLAYFNSASSGLNFVALRFTNFTVRIDPKLLKPMFALNNVLFFFTMLNTPSDAFECGSTSTSFATLNKRRDQSDTSQTNLSFYLYIPIKYQLCSTWFFHHNNYKHSPN